MKYDFLVLGSSGMQGRIVTRDLLESGYKVACADLYQDGSEENLNKFPGTLFTKIDLRNYAEAQKIIASIQAPVVINCVEGDWNIDVYQMCLEEKCHVIDLGSDIPMTKLQLDMNVQFAAAGLVAITGCGSTPGINNVMMKYASQFFHKIDTIELGFAWDSNIKKFVVPFSMASIFEELTAPAAVLENGEWHDKIPMATEEIREFREIGAQQCYIVRHPETYSFAVDYAKLKPNNIRFYAGFPAHSLETLNKLIELGFDQEEPLLIEGQNIRPIDAMSRILTRLKKPDQYAEKENLWVKVSGTDVEGQIVIVNMECIVSNLPGWEGAGCNVDTGLPASIMAQMILDGRVTARGSFAPDLAIPTLQFFKELRKRGMTVFKNGTALTEAELG